MKSNTFKLTAVALAALVAALPLTASADDDNFGPGSSSSTYSAPEGPNSNNAPDGSKFDNSDEYLGEAHGASDYDRLGKFDDVEVTETSIADGGGWK